ncbi:hypothetical protein DOR57_23180 [Salmonella enterica subsp. salamae]|uniref:Uncharacterized protein n=1 Tax=Salmonella enterica subsp. enterica serovar Kottbus TaxID=224727 RepID=A0A5J0SE30_SALET|nr:hypothetical protein [Salmonella enterica subsp. enterica serovar Kottbus]ECC1508139.1 hypothetical protein [Salmonella enterica subsp. houtenae]ECG0942770.1 hypothetical protein [Salmonella enterica subsp. salamae]EDE8444936.1 hypothetical protein [Salmonella enterica subsp. enterica serovar Pomona]EDJ1504734.1 hypothetical protein [Salmonella enterica]EDM0594529.1 hypothetical protein [Salmonella enterica subsp. enterica serovar Cerro]EDN4397041.1 hypothetical protein [Salmonella enteric
MKDLFVFSKVLRKEDVLDAEKFNRIRERNNAITFLRFISNDINEFPQNVLPFDMSRGRELVADMGVNIDDDIYDEY